MHPYPDLENGCSDQDHSTLPPTVLKQRYLAACVAIKCTNMLSKHRLLLLLMLLTLLFNNKCLSSLYRSVLVTGSVLFLSLFGVKKLGLTFKGLLWSTLLDVTLC